MGARCIVVTIVSSPRLPAPSCSYETGASAWIADRWSRSLASCCKRLRCHRARCIDSRQRWEALVKLKAARDRKRATGSKVEGRKSLGEIDQIAQNVSERVDPHQGGLSHAVPCL